MQRTINRQSNQWHRLMPVCREKGPLACPNQAVRFLSGSRVESPVTPRVNVARTRRPKTDHCEAPYTYLLRNIRVLLPRKGNSRSSCVFLLPPREVFCLYSTRTAASRKGLLSTQKFAVRIRKCHTLISQKQILLEQKAKIGVAQYPKLDPEKIKLLAAEDSYMF